MARDSLFKINHTLFPIQIPGKKKSFFCFSQEKSHHKKLYLFIYLSIWGVCIYQIHKSALTFTIEKCVGYFRQQMNILSLKLNTAKNKKSIRISVTLTRIKFRWLDN